MLSDEDVNKWESYLAKRGGRGSDGCDLAQLIWNGEVSDEHQVRLLSSPHPSVREAVAWAIGDLGRDGVPLRTLYRLGPSDPSASVRRDAILSIEEVGFLSSADRQSLAAPFIKDCDSGIALTAKRILNSDT